MSSKKLENNVGEIFLIELSELHEFQGDLKFITSDNLDAFKAQLLQNGFSDPFAVFKNDNKWFMIDGHQRKLALTSLKADNVEIPPLPAVEIKAKSIKHAREILAAISSQYGEYDVPSLKSWMESIGDSCGENLRLVDTKITFDLDFDLGLNRDEEEKDENTRSVKTCPSCGHEW